MALVVSVLVLGAPAVASAAFPEGYGYEMVTPLDTKGQRAIVGATTDDGNRMLFTSPGGFAGTEHLPDLGIQYIAERGPGGWTTSAIAPPASQFPFIGYGAVDYSDDLLRSLWVVNKKEDDGTFALTPIVREADGTFVEAGPTLNDGSLTSAVVGASNDMRTVVLSTNVRPALTDGTTDTRSVAQKSLYVAHRDSDGSMAVRQVAYRAGATMAAPSCPVVLGGLNTTARGSVSWDGSKIFFSTGGALSACTNVNVRRVWVAIDGAEPVDLSASRCTVDCGTAQQALFEGGARDGSRVYFSTTQKLLDGDQDTSAKSDLYEYDFDDVGNELKLVTGSAAPAGAGVLRVVRVSDDGSHVYFVANGRPLTGPNSRGEEPLVGGPNLYVYERGRDEQSGTTKFIATLVAGDSTLWTGGDTHRYAKTSTNGRFLILASLGNLTGERQPGDSFIDIFHYDAQTDELQRVWSPDPAHNGAARVNGATLSPPLGTSTDGGLQRSWNRERQMADDGRIVSFTTLQQLSPDDVNDQVDVYVWDSVTGAVTMISSGKSVLRTRRGPMTPSGHSIFIGTDAPLSKWHTSGAESAFVFRLGGGFPDPVVPPGPCIALACEGPSVVPPALPAAGTVSFAGEGNVPGSRVNAAVRISRPKAVAGSAASLRVRVPAAGRISVAGASIRGASRSASRAGTYVVKVLLRPAARRALKKRGALRVVARVSYRAQDGQSVRRTIEVAFKQPKAKRGKGKKGGR